MGRYGQIALMIACISTVLMATTQEAVAEQTGDAIAEEAIVEEATPDDSGLVHQSALAIRATPIGLSLFSDTGYKVSLWDDPESDLFSNTKLEGGVTTALSPAFGWVGPYVEFMPVAALRLRLAAQFMGYFGNFGFLYVPEGEGELDWSSAALDRAEEEGLGVSSTGYMIHAQATPQMRFGRIVVTAETNFQWIRMGVDSDYYEPYYDLLFAPQEFMWITRPTLGYLFGAELSEGYVLVGARWERAATSQTELVRDTVGMVFNWKVHNSIMQWGDPSIAGFGGVFIDHPDGDRGEISPYFGVQAVVNF